MKAFSFIGKSWLIPRRIQLFLVYALFDCRNDNVPEFTQREYIAVISEDTAIGQEVVVVTAIDPDENDPITYRIASGGMLPSPLF